jgi:CRP-like cAMP-binding protein
MSKGVPKAVVDMLKAVPLFSECSVKEIREIANVGTPVRVNDGKVLTEQGRPGLEFFLLIEGKARCLVDGAEVAQFGPGDFFGEMALLDHGPRHATVVADGQAELLVLNGAEFRVLLDASPSIAQKLLTALAQRERANATIRS